LSHTYSHKCAASKLLHPWVFIDSLHRVPYRLEVLKGGAIVDSKDVSLKDHHTFGRTPGCDFILEHPSASRLHAVSNSGVACVFALCVVCVSVYLL